jgi:hypothetical protein
LIVLEINNTQSGAALGSYYVKDVYTVAERLAATAEAEGAQFVVNVGDSFYWCGIQNTSDFQIAVDFEEPYTAPSLQVYHSGFPDRWPAPALLHPLYIHLLALLYISPNTLSHDDTE